MWKPRIWEFNNFLDGVGNYPGGPYAQLGGPPRFTTPALRAGGSHGWESHHDVVAKLQEGRHKLYGVKKTWWQGQPCIWALMADGAMANPRKWLMYRIKKDIKCVATP